MNIYEIGIIKDIETIQKGVSSNIINIDKYPSKTAYNVLQILLEWACQPQNALAIMTARNYIKKIKYEWLRDCMMDVANKCIDFSDEWEYRRFIELIIYAVPELKDEVIKLGESSDNIEIKKAAYDFIDQ